jgi:hypothetical protein
MFPYSSVYSEKGVDVSLIPNTHEIVSTEPIYNNDNNNNNNDYNDYNEDNNDTSYSPAELDTNINTNINIDTDTIPKPDTHTRIKGNKNKGTHSNSNKEHETNSKENNDINEDFDNNDINTEIITAIDVIPEVNSNEIISSNENSNNFTSSKNDKVVGQSNVSAVSVSEYNEKAIDDKGVKNSLFTISISSIIILFILGSVLSVMVIKKRMRNKKQKESNNETPKEDNCEPFPPFKPDRPISELKDPVEACEEYLNSLSRLKYKSPNETYGKNNNNFMPTFPFFVSPTLVSEDYFISNNPDTSIEIMTEHPDSEFENNNKPKELDESLRPTSVISSASEIEEKNSDISISIQPTETEENNSNINNNNQPSENEENTSQISIQVKEEESTTMDNLKDEHKNQ